MHQDAVKKMLRQIGLKPQVAAGQNFLLDEDICREMIEVAEIGASDTVLEVGPGLGVLTKPLLATGAKVIAVELDQRLAQYLQKTLGKEPNFTLVHEDIFKVNLHTYLQDFQYSVVANLPYSVTSLFFRNLLTQVPRPKRITAMLQKEVVERMVAEPGGMSLLSLLVQYYSEATFVMSVPQTSFWPAPAVTSAIIDVRLTQPAPDTILSQKMFRLARVAFSGRRKTLANSLSALTDGKKEVVVEKLTKIGLNPQARPQELTLDNWLTLAKADI